MKITSRIAGAASRYGIVSRVLLSRIALSALTAVAGIGLTVSPIVMRPASAQTVDVWPWKSVNTQGMGYVTGISISPQSPYDVYVRTDVGGGYRYDRTNEKWVPLHDAFDTNVSGGGIGVESIVADPSNNNRVYAAINYGYSTTNNYGIFTYNYGGEVLVSNDKGTTWTPTGLATGAHPLYVGPNSGYRTNTGERIGVDPNKGDLIYFASARDGLWKKDGTGAWTQVTNGLPTPDSLPGYYFYPDQGAPYFNQNFPGFTFVLFDKSTGSAGTASQTVYAGVFGSGVYKSTNGGASWALMPGSYLYPRRGVIASNGTLYVSGGTDGDLQVDSSKVRFPSSGSVYRYASNTWTEIRPTDNSAIYTGIAVDPNVPGSIVVGRGRDVWRSTTSGTSWSGSLKIANANDTLNGAPGYYNINTDADSGLAAMAIDPSNGAKVWWTNGWGVARTEDITAATPIWTFRMQNLEELDANMVRVPPKAGGAAVWLAAQDILGFRITDPDVVPASKFNPNNIPTDPNNAWANGTATTFGNPFPHVAGVTGIDYCYNQPDMGAFVGFHQWQYQNYGPSTTIAAKTTDNGVTWNAFPSVPTENFYISWANLTAPVRATGGVISVSPTDPNRMVWAPTGGVWPMYTTDGGQNWYLCYNLSHGAQPSPYDPNNADHTHYDKLPKSWSINISPWVSSSVLAADRADPTGQSFYYYTGFDFFYSTDGGVNWTTSNSNGLIPDWCVRATIAPNPLTKGDVWLACARNAETQTTNPLYRSTDGGQTFNVVSGVDSAEFIAFGKNATSTTVPTLYIWGRIGGATKDAMYKTDNLGVSWVRISDPTTTQFPGIINMDADMRTPNLVYLATGGRGFAYGKKATTGTGTGLQGSYFNNITLTGTPILRTDSTVNFNWGTGTPGVTGIGADNFSVRWDGQVEAPATGTYTFTTNSDDGVRLWVNGTQLVNNWTDHSPTNNSGTISLTAGQKYTIKMEYYEKSGGAVAKLLWAYPGQASQAVPSTRLYTPVVVTDTAKYNFESGIQGWSNAAGSATPSQSSTIVYAGTKSLAVAINATGASDNGVRVLNAGASTPMPAAGTPVTFRVYVPSGAAIDSAYVYSQDANWGWTSASITLTPGQWNTVTLTIPTGAVTPMNALGVTFHTTGAWNGTCYIDSINW